MYDEQSFNDASEQRQRLEKEFEKKKKKKKIGNAFNSLA